MPEWRDRDAGLPLARDERRQLAGYQPIAAPGAPATPPQGGTGAVGPGPDARKLAANRDIIDRIVADKVRDAHLLRCIVQGCHPKTGGPCQYCGAIR